MSQTAEQKCAIYEEILRCVCSHLQLPQSESGPADDIALYDRALEAADLYEKVQAAELAVHKDKRFKAEAALERLRMGAEPFAIVAAKLPDSRVMHEKSPFWRKAEIEWANAAQLLTAGNFRELLRDYEEAKKVVSPAPLKEAASS